MKILSLFIAFIIFNPLFSQAKLLVDKELHDFGEINEMDNVFHVFTLTNIGKDTLIITEIQPECGCTTPEIGSKIIAPGAQTGLKVKYDAKGRIGAFSKKIAIYSNSIPFIDVVFIAGNVSPASGTGLNPNKPTQELWLNKNEIKLDTIDNLQLIKFSILVKNQSDKPKKIQQVKNLPDGLTCLNPTMTIKSMEEKAIEFVFNAKDYNDYGRVLKQLTIVTDDKYYGSKMVLFEAFITPYFETPPKKAKKYKKWIAKQPAAKISRTSINFGEIASGAIVKDTVTITNTGRDTLKILKLYSSCACFAASANKGMLSPGETAVITLTFDAVARKGRQVKEANIMINDPVLKELKFVMEAQVNR